jgi:hypothetical protein
MKKQFNITIKGTGTPEEIIASLKLVIDSLDAARHKKNPSKFLDGATWNATLLTQINKA